MKRESVLFIIFIILVIISIVIGLFIIKSKPEKKREKEFRGLLFKGRSFSKYSIGLIRIYEPISNEGYIGFWGGSFVERVIKMLEEYAYDDKVKGIILRINSPGGTVAASQEIYRAILRIRYDTGKPVVAYLTDVAASGAYYIASATDYIVANPGTLTGSIGVIMTNLNVRELLEKIGIKPNIIKQGKFKDIGSYFKEMSEEERKLLEEITRKVYNQMLEDIKKGRPKLKKLEQEDYEKFKSVVDGRIFTGEEALEVGLVDELGGMKKAVRYIMKEQKLEEEPEIIEFPKISIEKFFERFFYSAQKNFWNIIFKEVLENKIEEVKYY